MKKILRAIGKPFTEVGAVYLREFRIVKSDVGLILFFLFLPLVYPVLYSLIYNPEVVRNISVVVVDRDRSAESRDLVRKFDATPAAYVKGYAADLPEARRAVNEGEAFAILEIPEHFGSDLGNGKQATPVLYCEVSLLLRYRELLVASTGVSLDMGENIQHSRISESGGGSIIPAGESFPMAMSYRPMGNISSGFDSFIMPGVLMLILHQCIVLAIGMRGGSVSESPRLCEYYPVNYVKSTFLTMAGQCLCYYTLLFIPLIWMVHFVPLIFHFPMAGNPVQIMVFLLPYILSAMMLGYFVQAFVTEREAIFVIWVITSLVLLFLSGLTWPTYAMKFPWNLISDMLPSTWGVQGFIRMNGDGATLADVGTDYRNLWLLTAFWGVLGYLMQRLVVRPRARLAIVTRACISEGLLPEREAKD